MRYKIYVKITQKFLAGIKKSCNFASKLHK